jgi:hypothetical protein
MDRVLFVFEFAVDFAIIEADLEAGEDYHGGEFQSGRGENS